MHIYHNIIEAMIQIPGDSLAINPMTTQGWLRDKLEELLSDRLI